MSEKTGFERCWEGVDRLLLILVFILLAVCWWDSERTGGRFRLSGVGAVRRAEPAPISRRLPPTLRRVTEGAQVALERNRVSHIARAMAESEWESQPTSPAADMREQNGFYDIFFALPERMEFGSVKVSTSGNVLTLFISSTGTPAATFVKQFYIPCGAERAGAVETSVSNDVIRVRIRQPGG